MSVIPFPRLKSHKHSMNQVQRQAVSADGVRHTRNVSDGYVPLKIDLASCSLPRVTDVYDLMNEQCDVLMDALEALVEYMEEHSEEAAAKLDVIRRRSRTLSENHVGFFQHASTAAVDFIFLFRMTNSLELAVDCTRSSTDKFLEFSVPADRFMLEMTIENRNFAQTLKRGLRQLTLNSFSLAENALCSRNAIHNTEKIHLRALAELADDGRVRNMRKADQWPTKVESDLYGVLKRREIYYALFKNSKRLVGASSRLREIVLQTQRIRRCK